jgi:hypothetical protein
MFASVVLLLLTACVVSAQTLPPDMIAFPNFAVDASRPHKTAVSGAWGNPATWGGAVPAASDIVSIPAGVTVTLTQPATAYSTVVDGTLSVSAPFVVVTLIVNGPGRLTAAPGAAIIFADTPIDLAFDPQQFGHGAVFFGTVQLQGTPTTAWVDLAAEPQAGSTQLTLGGPVVNWKPGDTLVLNDSRVVRDGEWHFDAVGGPKRLIDMTERNVIASISGTDVTLTTPLLWTHPAGRDEHNDPLFSQVGNLTRDVVIASANPLGVRGCIRSTLRADIDIENTAFVGLGRTKATALDNTMLNPDGSVMHMGENPIGCYAYHSHYLTGPLPSGRPFQSRFIGNVIDGSPKVGIAVHHSHFGLYQDLIITNAIGTDLLIEAGDETGNVLDHIFYVNSQGSEDGVEDDVSHSNLGTNVWVAAGSGTPNAFTNSVFSTTRQAAIWFQVVPGTLHCPVGPGIDPRDQSVPCSPYTQPLTTFKNNKVLSHFGGLSFEYGEATIENSTFWNITQDWAIRVGRSGTAHSLTLKNVKVFPGASNRYFTSVQAEVQHFSATNFVSIGASAGGIFTNQPGKYLSAAGEPVTFSIDGGDIQGGSVALTHNLTWGGNGGGGQAPNNAAGNTPTIITLNNLGLVGAGRVAVNAPYSDGMDANQPYTFTVTNYQHIPGYNFRLYPLMSAPDELMPPTTSPSTSWQPLSGRAFYDSIGAPVAGLTNAQATALFGLAFLGEMAPCATAEPGIGGAFACGGPFIPIPDPPPLPIIQPPPGIAPPPPAPVIEPPPPPPPPPGPIWGGVPVTCEETPTGLTCTPLP